MDDQTKNVINNNIQPKSNMEFKDQQSSDTNLNLINSDEPKNKKKENKKKRKIIKKNNTQKYIQSIIEDECINYEHLQKEGIPAIIPHINDEGKKILYSYKRKSGPNYDYRCKDRNCNGLANLKKMENLILKKIVV